MTLVHETLLPGARVSVLESLDLGQGEPPRPCARARCARGRAHRDTPTAGGFSRVVLGSVA